MELLSSKNQTKTPWNKGKIVGQKPALKLKGVMRNQDRHIPGVLLPKRICEMGSLLSYCIKADN
jgi:phage protein U